MILAHSIAVFLPNWVGDVVMATPALRALRKHFERSRITHIGPPVALETLEGTDLADEQLPDLSRQPPSLRNFIRQVRSIRRNHFDLSVLFANSFRSALLCWLGGARPIAGYDRDGRGCMLTHKLTPPRDDAGTFAPIPAIDYYNALVGMLAAETTSQEMVLSVTPEGESAVKELFAQARIDPKRPIVMLNPGGSFGPSKMWAPERFAVVSDTLCARRSVQIIINAAPSERDVAAKISASMMRQPAINFAVREGSISILKSLMRRTNLLITNDTGARHVAAAMGVSVVTIFGSTDPKWTEINYPKEQIVRVDVPCGPCQSKACLLPRGPSYHECMMKITPEDVLEAAERMLDRDARERSGDKA